MLPKNHEICYKSVKSSLNKLLRNLAYTEEKYKKVSSQVTLIANSRPLWPASDGDIFPPAITCNDLLRPTRLL